ncbi:hypothetical protein FJZ40_00640 [Candidatus Shapirobacteria bacterium]|nr:hypothetical protein [Candidatus Shapirobacteria bacterium]
MKKRFKRIFSIILILYTLYSTLYTPAWAAGASFSLSPASGTYKVGTVITATLTLDTAGNQSSGADAILLYEPEKLAAQSIVAGSIYDSYPEKTINSTGGKITISGITTDPSLGFLGKGTFATVKLKVLTSGTTTIRYDFNPGGSQDSNVAKKGSQGEDILSSVSNATYTLSTTGGGGGTNPSPTPPVSGASEFTIITLLGGLTLIVLSAILAKPLAARI